MRGPSSSTERDDHSTNDHAQQASVDFAVNTANTPVPHHEHPAHATHVMPDGTVMQGTAHGRVHQTSAGHEDEHHAYAPTSMKPVPEGDHSQVEYTCPMHPQVRQMGPGHCPICGMALEPVLATTEASESPELRDMTR